MRSARSIPRMASMRGSKRNSTPAGSLCASSTTCPARERHFDLLAQIAETPIQKSRAAYWLARTAEARHTPEEDANAHDYYAEAATHSTTFYGQLALAKLGSTASPLRPAADARSRRRARRFRAGRGVAARVGRKGLGRPTRRRRREASDRRIASRRAGRGGRASPRRQGFSRARQARLASRRRARRSRLPRLWRAALHEPAGFGVALDRLRHRAAGKRLRSARDLQRPRDGPDADDRIDRAPNRRPCRRRLRPAQNAGRTRL